MYAKTALNIKLFKAQIENIYLIVYYLLGAVVQL